MLKEEESSDAVEVDGVVVVDADVKTNRFQPKTTWRESWIFTTQLATYTFYFFVYWRQNASQICITQKSSGNVRS